jgi:hypothetical protein
MGEVIFRFDCEVVYEPGDGIEVHLRHGGTLSREAMQHLARAGKDVSLALQHLAKPESERPKEKVRTKIEIEEA